MTDQKFMATVSPVLLETYFHDTDIGLVYGLIRKFHFEHGRNPSKSELRCSIMDAGVLSQVTNVMARIKGIDSYDESLMLAHATKFIKYRGLYTSLLDVAKTGFDKINPSKFLESVESVLNVSFDMERGFDMLNQITDFIDFTKSSVEMISTGWAEMDKKLGGGLAKNGKALYVFAGQPNVGKSVVLGNLAVNIMKQNKKVLLVSLEMSEMVYSNRLVANAVHVPMSELHASSDDIIDGIASIKETHPNAGLIVKEYAPETLTVPQLRNYIKDLAATGFRPDVVIVDYLNLLAQMDGDNSYERIKKLCVQLRALSYLIGCPIVTATQINRSGTNTESPGLENISESMGTAQTADVVISIYQSDDDKELNIIRMAGIKNRQGPQFSGRPYKLNHSILALSEMDESDILSDSEESSNTLASLGA